MKTFRILENNETYWQGKAYDVDHALEKCYDDEQSGSMVKLRVEEWATVKFSSSIKGKGWVKRWEGQLNSY